MAAENQKPFREIYPDVVAWLENYKGDFEFYLSLRDQLDRRDFLSDKQITSVRNAIARDQQVKPKPFTASGEWANPTYKAGTILSMSQNTATRMAKEHGLEFTYRNIEIVKTHRETERGLLVTIKFTPQIGRMCSICGRHLDTAVSRATGIGPVCADRMGISRYSHGDAKEILAQLAEKIGMIGEIKEVWLPRFRVKPLDQVEDEDFGND